MGRPPRIPHKRPPAPSVRKRRATSGPDVRAQIAGEICAAFDRLDADKEPLSITGSWRDTLDDRAVLSLLRDYNAGLPTLRRAQ
jgi:hypothetical protein